ncbi:MAG: hypothetical protein KTR28_05730 [Micavibrio sp.]|nr:hypothetical protein [Micavibrio sp.]
MDSFLNRHKNAFKNEDQSFSAASVIDKNIFQIHKTLQQEKKHIASRNQKNSFALNIGNLALTLKVTPLFNTKNQNIGATYTWIDDEKIKDNEALVAAINRS